MRRSDQICVCSKERIAPSRAKLTTYPFSILVTRAIVPSSLQLHGLELKDIHLKRKKESHAPDFSQSLIPFFI